MVLRAGNVSEGIAGRIPELGASSSSLQISTHISKTWSKIQTIKTPSVPTSSTKRYSPGESFSILCLASIQLAEGRQLAESTATCVLDEPIKAYPRHLELFRTRRIVHIFLGEYSAAVKDFTMRLRKPELCARLDPSIAMAVTILPRPKRPGLPIRTSTLQAHQSHSCSSSARRLIFEMPFP
jgi:hypothetical protein